MPDFYFWILVGGEGEKAFRCTGGRKDDRCSCFNLRLMWRYVYFTLLFFVVIFISPTLTHITFSDSEDGQGELYAYLPITEANTRRLLSVPGSHQNPDYGFSVGRGTLSFNAGKWTTVAERVKLNDVGQENGESSTCEAHQNMCTITFCPQNKFTGEIELWVDGKSVIKVTGLVLRNSQESVIQGLHFQTFFGGVLNHNIISHLYV